MVEALLSGRVRRRIVARGPLRTLLVVGLHNPLPADLVVEVGRGDRSRTYTAPIVLAAPTGMWLATLPTIDESQDPPDAGTAPRGRAGS